MSTINLCGFETGDASEAYTTSGTFSVQNTTARNSGYALRSNPTGSATGYFGIEALAADGTPVAASVATSFIRFYFLWKTKPTSNDEDILSMRRISAFAKFALRLNSAGKLVAYDSNASLLATGSTVLSSSTWYRIELKVATGSSVAWEVKVDDTSEISGTGAVGAQNASDIALGKGFSINNNNTVDFYFDDFYWDDTAYPGAGQCSALLPNANGNYQTWSIGAGSGSHYQIVNERPPDGDTSYLLSPLITNDFETEALTNSGTAGITGVVNCVKSVAIFKQNVSGGTVRVALRSSTTDDVTSSDYTVTGTYKALSKLYATDPATSASWVVANLDSVESGAKCTSAVNQVRMTFTAAMVDYKPVSSYTCTTTDAPATAESLAMVALELRSETEAPITSESLARTGAFARVVAESSVFAESLVRASTVLRSATSAPVIAESTIRTFAGLRATSESPSYAESLSRTFIGLRSSVEAVSFAESTIRTFAGLRSASEATLFAESTSRVVSLFCTQVDVVATSESVVETKLETRTVAESPMVSDTSSRVYVGIRSGTDSASTADVAAGVHLALVSASEALSVTGTGTRLLTVARTSGDSSSLSESSIGIGILSRLGIDSTTLNENLLRQLTVLRSGADSTSVVDSVSRVEIVLRHGVDTLVTSDTVTETTFQIRITVDMMHVSESAEIVTGNMVHVSDVVHTLDYTTAISPVTEYIVTLIGTDATVQQTQGVDVTVRQTHGIDLTVQQLTGIDSIGQQLVGVDVTSLQVVGR